MYVLSHMYVFPNVESISSAKSFSLGNLSLLTNFLKFFTVSNSVSSVVAYIFIKRCYACSQGRNEVTWRPGQEASLAPPYSHLRSFGSKCIEESRLTCDIVRTFRCSSQSFCAPCSDLAPHSIRRSGNCVPLPLSLRPCLLHSN